MLYGRAGLAKIIVAGIAFLLVVSLCYAGDTPIAWVLEGRGTVSQPGCSTSLEAGLPLNEGDLVIVDRGSMVKVIYKDDGIYTLSSGEEHKVTRGKKSAGSLTESYKNLLDLLVARIKGAPAPAPAPAPSTG